MHHSIPFSLSDFEVVGCVTTSVLRQDHVKGLSPPRFTIDMFTDAYLQFVVLFSVILYLIGRSWADESARLWTLRLFNCSQVQGRLRGPEVPKGGRQEGRGPGGRGHGDVHRWVLSQNAIRSEECNSSMNGSEVFVAHFVFRFEHRQNEST